MRPLKTQGVGWMTHIHHDGIISVSEQNAKYAGHYVQNCKDGQHNIPRRLCCMSH